MLFTDKMYSDGDRLYKMKYDMASWGTQYVLDAFWGQTMFRNYMVRKPSVYWKVVVYTVSASCRVEEIDRDTYNIPDKLIDYTHIRINNQSYLCLLFE